MFSNMVASSGRSSEEKPEASERTPDHNLPIRASTRIVLAELEIVQPPIEPAGAVELVVGASLHDPALVQHDDLVGVAHGGEAVGDHQHGALAHQPVDRLLHQPLGFGVERAGGLVEDEDRRVAQQRAGDGDPLPLTAGEPGAPLAEHGVEALGELADEPGRVGGLGRRLDPLPRGARASRRRCWRTPCC